MKVVDLINELSSLVNEHGIGLYDVWIDADGATDKFEIRVESNHISIDQVG